MPVLQGIGPDGEPLEIKATADGQLETNDGGTADDDPLERVALLLADLLDEQRAVRLILQEMMNAGNDIHNDYLKLSRSIRDDANED